MYLVTPLLELFHEIVDILHEWLVFGHEMTIFLIKQLKPFV